MTEPNATQIAWDWNVPHVGAGYVTRFCVRKASSTTTRYTRSGGRTSLEYRIPADDLDEFNTNVVGTIELITEYRRPDPAHPRTAPTTRPLPDRPQRGAWLARAVRQIR